MTTTTVGTPPTAVAPEPRGEPKPPRTVLGLERWTVLPAIAVAAVVAFFALGLPWVDSLVSDSPAGTEPLDVGFGATVTPPGGGWELVDDETGLGSAGASGNLTMIRAGVTLTAFTGTFTGSARELLDTDERHEEELDGPTATGPVGTATTSSGVQGASQTHRSGTQEGRIFTFVEDGVGVTLRAFGSHQAMTQARGAVHDYVASLDLSDLSGGAS